MRLVTIVVVVLLVAGLAVAEDKLLLKDGQVVTGKILAETGSDVQIETPEETIRVPLWAIEKIERDKRAASTSGSSALERTAPQRGNTRRIPVRSSPEATPEMLKWVETCIGQLGSRDEGVRAGAAAALRAAGGAAAAALEKATKSDDPIVARDSKRLLTQVNRIEGRIATQKRASMSKLDLMVESLELGKDEAATFRGIIEEFQLRQRDLTVSIRSGKVDVADAADRMDALDEERNQKLSAALTAEQMDKYLEQWAKRQRPQTFRSSKR